MVNFNSALTTSGAAATGQVSQQKTNITADPAINAAFAGLTKLGATPNARLNKTANDALKALITGVALLKNDPMADAARQTFLKK